MRFIKDSFKLTWMAAFAFFGFGMLTLSPIVAADIPATVYVMQADDRLEKLAEKYYSDPLAYPTIVKATNEQAAIDNRFSAIENPAQVTIGQYLFIPNLTPGSNELVRSETLPDEIGPTAEQQELLATLQNEGVPPELHNEVWLNSEPLKLANLRGRVVIVEFWTYG